MRPIHINWTTWPVHGLCPYVFGVVDLEISRVVSRVDLARTVFTPMVTLLIS